MTLRHCGGQEVVFLASARAWESRARGPGASEAWPWPAWCGLSGGSGGHVELHQGVGLGSVGGGIVMGVGGVEVEGGVAGQLGGLGMGLVAMVLRSLTITPAPAQQPHAPERFLASRRAGGLLIPLGPREAILGAFLCILAVVPGQGRSVGHGGPLA